MVIYSHLVLFF
jgi:hypothetical protein